MVDGRKFKVSVVRYGAWECAPQAPAQQILGKRLTELTLFSRLISTKLYRLRVSILKKQFDSLNIRIANAPSLVSCG